MNQSDARAGHSSDHVLCLASDEALVDSAKAGMHPAYAELCRRHSLKVFRTVHRVTRNKEDAEDALQDALMKAFTHLHRFDGRSAFSTWLTRIAINSALMAMRKKRTQSEISFDCDAWSHLQIPDPGLDPERHLCERERSYRVQTAVERLPGSLRSVTEIRYSQDISVIEVAALTSVSVAAAKSRLIRARRLLLHALGERGPQGTSPDSRTKPGAESPRSKGNRRTKPREQPGLLAIPGRADASAQVWM